MNGFCCYFSKIHILHICISQHFNKLFNDWLIQQLRAYFFVQRHVNNYAHTVKDKVSDGVVKHNYEHTQKFFFLRKLGRANLSMS